MQYTRPTTTKEAEKLVWIACNATHQPTCEKAKATLLAACDPNGFFKVFDDEEQSYCLFLIKIKENKQSLIGKVASHYLDFSVDEDDNEIRQKLLPYAQDQDLQDYIRYFCEF